MRARITSSARGNAGAEADEGGGEEGGEDAGGMTGLGCEEWCLFGRYCCGLFRGRSCLLGRRSLGALVPAWDVPAWDVR